jgi:hypothetical protein
MGNFKNTFARDIRIAKSLYGDVPKSAIEILRHLLNKTKLSISRGEVVLIGGAWFVKHVGLLNIAHRRRCSGICTELLLDSSAPALSRWVFKATVYRSPACKGFVGYGDADPSNVSYLVHGAEMRVAETRAVNRALRKAYGIGICSVEEIGALAPETPREPAAKKLPPQSAKSNGKNSQEINGNGSRVRDRLCQIIRRHALDAKLVKSYAVDFCGAKTLRDASREQVENFVIHLADWAEKDRNALLCQLNSYSRPQAGAA